MLLSKDLVSPFISDALYLYHAGNFILVSLDLLLGHELSFLVLKMG